MEWNDGISKEMDKYFNNVLANISEVSIDSIKEVVDKASAQFYNDVQKDTPIRSGGLQKSLVQEKIDTGDYYGTKNMFEGNDANGVPYEKIANILNYGKKDGSIDPKYFVTRAVRKLKSIDKDIDKTYEQKMSELDKRS